MKKTFRYLIFVFLLVLGGVTLAACGTNKALAKEEDAFMVQAVQASSMSGNTSAYIDDNITVASDTTISTEIKTEIKNALAEGLAEQIDELLAQIETMIDSIEITHGESDREGYEKMMSYSQVNLKGEKVEYILYYNVTDYEEEDDDDELEIEIEYKGVLVIKANGAEVEHEVTGEVEIEEGERSIKTWIKDDVRVFEITKITPLLQIKRTQIRSYMNNNAQVVEIIPEVDPIGNLFKKRIIFTKEKLENSDVLSVEMIDESNLFQFINNIKITITATDENEQTKYHYRFYGKLKIGQITHDHEFNYYYNQKKRNSK